MRETIIILLCLAILAIAFARKPERTKAGRFPWFGHLKGWQKLFGLIAVILAVLILMNPDFLVLGFLGDSTFFEILVLALSVQMLGFVQATWRRLCASLHAFLRWAGIPSPGLRSLLALLAVVGGTAVSLIQKIAHKILS